jgi:sterol 3beta-glucosyltransferase
MNACPHRNGVVIVKIGMQTWGTEGDLRPFIALAEGLRDAGHEVTLAMSGLHPARQEALRVRGVETHWDGTAHYTDQRDLIEECSVAMLRMLNPLAQLKCLLEFALDPILDELHETSIRLCSENDLVIGHFFLYPLIVAAQQAGKPHVSVSLSTQTIPTDLAPQFVTPNLGRWANRVSWKVAAKALDFVLLPSFNDFLRTQGLPGVQTSSAVMESRLLNLVAVSGELAPQPTGWEPHHKLCGFFNRNEPAGLDRLSDPLEAFLQAGDPPVYMGFGSMLSDTVNEHGVQSKEMSAYVEESTGLLLDTARRINRRVVIQAPWSNADQGARSDDVFLLNRAPHSRLFPRCSLIVHHGGSGTTQSTLKAGRPSVVVAHAADQPFFGRSLKRAGTCRHVLLRQFLSSRKLARAITRTLAAPALTQEAERRGERMKAENGVAVAVQSIEREGA